MLRSKGIAECFSLYDCLVWKHWPFVVSAFRRIKHYSRLSVRHSKTVIFLVFSNFYGLWVFSSSYGLGVFTVHQGRKWVLLAGKAFFEECLYFALYFLGIKIETVFHGTPSAQILLEHSYTELLHVSGWAKSVIYVVFNHFDCWLLYRFVRYISGSLRVLIDCQRCTTIVDLSRRETNRFLRADLPACNSSFPGVCSYLSHAGPLLYELIDGLTRRHHTEINSGVFLVRLGSLLLNLLKNQYLRRNKLSGFPWLRCIYRQLWSQNCVLCIVWIWKPSRW